MNGRDSDINFAPASYSTQARFSYACDKASTIRPTSICPSLLEVVRLTSVARITEISDMVGGHQMLGGSKGITGQGEW